MKVCRRSWMRGRRVRPSAVQPSRFLSRLKVFSTAARVSTGTRSVRKKYGNYIEKSQNRLTPVPAAELDEEIDMPGMSDKQLRDTFFRPFRIVRQPK